MGIRQLNRQESGIEFRRQIPGCMWNMLHILDYHYWHGIKKISPRRRNRRAKHTICCGYPKTISLDHYTDEVHNYLAADAIPLMDDQKLMEDTPSEKVSDEARIKGLMANEMPSKSQFHQDVSINQLGHSDELGRVTTDWPNPIIILERNSDPATSRFHVPSEIGDRLVSKSLSCNLSDGKQQQQLSREIPSHQFMESVDVLEMFKVNKKMFVEIIQDPDVQPTKNFHIQSNSDKKLKKSGSFPLAVSPDKLLRPIKLEHKWKETWSFPRGERFSTGAEEQNFVSVAQESEPSSSALQRVSIKHGWHQSFMRHLRDAMKRIRHTSKDRKKENRHTSITSLLHRIPSRSSDEKVHSERLKETSIHQDGCQEEKSSDNDNKNIQPPHMRRISFLNESMDRYAHLLENSLTRDTKWHNYQSRSLKLTNEDKFSANGSNLRSFRRRLSLPDLDSFCPLPIESSEKAFHSAVPVKNDGVEVKSVRIGTLDVVEVTELQENTVEGCNSSKNDECSADLKASIEEEIADGEELQEDIIESEKQGDRPRHDSEISTVMSSTVKHENESPVSVLQTHFRHDMAGQTEFPFSKDSELCINEPDSSVNLQEIPNRNCSTGEDNENTQKKVDSNLLHFELNQINDDDDDFNYVRDVLELSGFIEQGYLGNWHSIDQPISPTLFKELEAYLHQELESSSQDFVGYNCNHQLLFDLVNEVLLQMYESSLAYFPKPFSFDRKTHTLPKGNHVLEEAWRRISWYRSSGLETDSSLDDMVARDLAKDESWMNLQLDSEDIALDIEDLIFDELVAEVMSL